MTESQPKFSRRDLPRRLAKRLNTETGVVSAITAYATAETIGLDIENEGLRDLHDAATAGIYIAGGNATGVATIGVIAVLLDGLSNTQVPNEFQSAHRTRRDIGKEAVNATVVTGIVSAVPSLIFSGLENVDAAVGIE